MIPLTWMQWSDNISQEDIYFFINSTFVLDTINFFYSNDWIEEAIPLYNRETRLSHLEDISPWLIKIKSLSRYSLAKKIDEFLMEKYNWGWVYHSELNWDVQITHWKNHQIVIVNNEEVHLRLFDPRVAGILFPHLKKEDWFSLMYPVNNAYIPFDNENLFFEKPKEILKVQKEISSSIYTLPSYLLDAWRHSTHMINLVVENLILNFWEENGELAYSLFSREKDIKEVIYKWVNKERLRHTDIAYLNNKNLLSYLLDVNLIKKDEI
ncbi:TPA: DUF4123 domain-containing protein [Proteus mirabilis]|uniref:DUF4123 domain-containing protein n=1 Tax=Proteus mirabilis TaxID=584 RepID=UPI00249E8A55|nr:DUF4123 domain-containing protein [Proteus mirabilis]WGY27453.1 DUF4123 domain-containing protein [Proteus mirabilis]HEK2640725.1 DUF4123 domain-containing protein [Proteus mirabilis]